VADCHFSCGSYRKHHVSSPVMIRFRNVPSSSALSIRSPQVLMATVTLVLRQDARNTVLGNTKHVQVTRQNSVASTTANPCCCDFIYRMAGTNTATSWVLSSVLTVLGRPVCSSSSKLSLPCAKGLRRLNTALRPKGARGSVVVKALCHKPEGRGFDSR
jgi:hypothetical protein